MIGLAPFFDLIRRRCGLNFESDRQPVLEAALAQRMTATGTASPAGYFTKLVGEAREFDDLVSLLTINETYFFREAPQLKLMVSRLIPRLLARPGRTLPLRILSAACSTGEEPYSIAMTLRDAYGDAVRQLFRVIGGDIDQRALARARQGVYTEFSFRGVDPDLITRYFRSDGSTYTIVPAAREIVEFTPMNLLDEINPEKSPRYDIIFLRNVTIYFDAAVRRSIQSRLRLMLPDDGYLIIGMAETLANDFGVMPLVQEDGLFYFTVGDTPIAPGPPPFAMVTRPPAEAAPAAAATPTPTPKAAATPPLAQPPTGTTVTPGLDEALRLTWEKSYDRALAVLEAMADAVPPSPDDLRPLILRAYILLNRKALAETEAAAARVLDREPWSIDALLVMGLAARHAEKPDAALSWFKRAAYAKHTCWPAHYYLADLHRAAGNADLARNAYRAALTLLSQASDTGIKVLLPAFPPSDIRFLCEHRLARL